MKHNHQSSANVYEYYYKHLGTFGLYEYRLLPQWKKDLKVKTVISNDVAIIILKILSLYGILGIGMKLLISTELI